MRINRTILYIFLFATVIVFSVLILQNQKLKKQVRNDAKNKIEQNEKVIDSVQKEDAPEVEERENRDQTIKDLEEQKSKPYGKKDYSNNTSVNRAEEYFAKRYRKDSANNR